jgi:hypothetical protein
LNYFFARTEIVRNFLDFRGQYCHKYLVLSFRRNAGAVESAPDCNGLGQRQDRAELMPPIGRVML